MPFAPSSPRYAVGRIDTMAERDAMLWHRIYALLGYFNNGMWRATRALDNLISLPLKLEFNFSISIERNGATTTNCVYCFLFRRKVRRCAWSWPTAHDSQEHDVSPDCVLPKKKRPALAFFRRNMRAFALHTRHVALQSNLCGFQLRRLFGIGTFFLSIRALWYLKETKREKREYQ